MLQSIAEFTREQSCERRRLILQQISDLFVVGAEGCSDRALELFSDILTKLLDQVPMADRVAVSEKVAPIEQTPHAVVIKLANDVAEVAAPVIEFSPVLTVGDLKTLAREKSQEHLLPLSRRDKLGEGITDIVVERGEDRVLSSVAANKGARFSHQALEQLAGKADSVRGLAEILAQRDDLPEDLATQIQPLLSVRAQARLQQLAAMDAEQTRTLINQAFSEVEASRRSIKRERLDVRLLIADIKAKKRRLDEGVDQLIFERRLADIATVMAEFAQMPVIQVFNALRQESAAAIAAVCRSLDLSATVYGRLTELRTERFGHSAANADEINADFEQLDKAMADRILRFHRVRHGLQSRTG